MVCIDFFKCLASLLVVLYWGMTYESMWAFGGDLGMSKGMWAFGGDLGMSKGMWAFGG